MRSLGLYIITALAEIIGCYLVFLWLQAGRSIWLVIPAAMSLAAFAFLLTLHPIAAGRVYAAYGGVYVAVAIVWLWRVEGIIPTSWDAAGMALMLVGACVIAWQPLSSASG